MGLVCDGCGGVLVIVALGVRYVIGLFALFGQQPLPGGQVWLGFAFGVGASLASAAFAQVAVGSIGAKLLEKITPGSSG